MVDQKSDDSFDPLILNEVYPDAKSILSFEPAPLKTVLQEGLIVIDTNVLLVPYSTGKDSLRQIQTTYSTLASENRLVIPGQVAREFAKNRSEKLKSVYQQVSRKRNVSIKIQSYPLLETVPEYQEVVRLESALDKQFGDYRKAISQLLETIGSWYWNDPVSSLYRELFKGNVVFELSIDREELLADLTKRQIHKLPPGYKDGGKEDNGIGDLLIWKAITELGRSHKKHVVFVSGDEKTDWWHQSENQALFPRFELVEEFRRVSGGYTFHIVSFSKLLSEFGASDAVVEEVRQEEKKVILDTATARHAARMARAVAAEKVVYKWLVNNHLDASIDIADINGPFDFIVKTDDATYGYDVKYFSKLRFSMGILRKPERYRNESEIPIDQKYVVLVTDDEEAERKFLRMLDRGPMPPGWGVIVGILNESGQFIELGFEEPMELSDDEESGA